MAKKTKKFYIALNAGANSFTDPNTLFNISGKQIREVGSKIKNSFFVKRGLRSGHLKEVTEAEYLEFKEKDDKLNKINKANSTKQQYIDQLKTKLAEVVDEKHDLEKRNDFLEKENETLKKELEDFQNSAEGDEDSDINFEEMTKDDIKYYLKENYELTEEHIKKMESFNKDALVDFANEIVGEDE